MRLSCQNAFLLLALAMAACTGPSDPSTISAHFILTDVDGHALPASAGTPSSTIISGAITFDQLGGAVLSEDRTDNGTLRSYTSNYIYTIQNGKIVFDYAVPCPPNANCVPPPSGAILDNGLRIQVVYSPGFVFQVYNYRVSATP